MSDILKDFAVKALNLTDERFAEIVYSDAEHQVINEGALDELIKLDAERIKQAREVAKTRETELHDKGYKKAQAESLAKFETSLREQFGVADTALQGLDLVKSIISKSSANVEITDDKIKLHPLYLQMERKLANEYVPKEEFDKVKGEFDGYKNNVEKEKVHAVVLTDGMREFRALKPNLPKDLTKAMNQEVDFLNKLKAFEFEIQPDGNHIIKVDGKRVETPQGHPVNFKDFIKAQAEKYYEFEVQGNRENSGNQNGTDHPITVPTTEAEYQLAIVNETDPMKRVQIKRAWEARK